MVNVEPCVVVCALDLAVARRQEVAVRVRVRVGRGLLPSAIATVRARTTRDASIMVRLHVAMPPGERGGETWRLHPSSAKHSVVSLTARRPHPTLPLNSSSNSWSSGHSRNQSQGTDYVNQFSERIKNVVVDENRSFASSPAG
jgi:hypothetical protein